MARIVEIKERNPVQIKEEDVGRWICMCGLSKVKPFCDGSHKSCSAEIEGKTYKYEDKGMEELTE